MPRPSPAYLRSLAALALVSAAAGACGPGELGATCTRNADCATDLVCAYSRGASEGICVAPSEDHGALPPPSGPGLPLPVSKDVDILFVIDNSGSMGEEQAILAQNFASFIEVLEADEVNANYRIGVTTSDNGNPWCTAGGTTPEAGKLVASSCKDRLGDFLFGGDIDVQDLACNDICTLSSAELEIQPTTTDQDSTAKPRPWLERIEGQTNLPAGTSMAEAFKCFGPQGVNGCGFESQLESMYLALVRATNPEEDNFGFLRASAILAVVFVTDEADCSYNRDYASIFESDGLKTFWSDPSAQFPSSAVCWNAGVECEGDPGNYSSCAAVNKDVNGQLGVDDDAAVLHPVSRYLGLLESLEQDKQFYDPDREVIVALIGGVGADGQPVSADVSATDPEFQDSFGIGPGCTAPGPSPDDPPVEAIPPVRIRDLSDALSPGNMFSICSDDYSAALGSIAEAIQSQIRPACYSQCAADLDPDTPELEVECIIRENPPGAGETQIVPECARDADGYLTDDAGDRVMPSDDATACHALLTDDPDDPLTSTPSDDLSTYCADHNFNLEIEIARRPGFPAASGTTLSATCALDEFPAVTCPGLGG